MAKKEKAKKTKEEIEDEELEKELAELPDEEETEKEEAAEEEAPEEEAPAEEKPAPAPEEAEEEEEKEEEKAKPKKKKKEEDIVEERFYTIPLGKALVRPPKKRAPRAMQLIRLFVTKHMKLATSVPEEETEELPTLTIDTGINEKVWSKGIEKPPRKIKVRTTKDKDGNVNVYLAEGK